MNGIDSFLRIDSGVGGAAGDADFQFAYALALRFAAAVVAECGFENQNGVAAAGFAFDYAAGSVAADFFVGIPQKNEFLLGSDFCALERGCGEERQDVAAFHVECGGAPGAAFGDAEGHARESAAVIDGIEMADDEELSRRGVHGRARVRRG